MTAIYTRQSVDKVDSISIETQIDFCKQRLLQGEKFEIFTDKGYSGGTQNRPEYQRLVRMCKNGHIERVITYKLDRISRSLLHFVLLLEDLEKSDVELISCTENFSSRSEMGVIIMKMLIMFAEMERKNIRSRIRDNYYSRGEKGFYLGGCAPYGYKKVSIKICGKSTSGYEIIDLEAKVLEEIYNLYIIQDLSANGVCRELNRRNILTKAGGKWSANTLLRVIRNPFYVKSDYRVYEFFMSEGAVVTSSAEDFMSGFGCVCYGDKGQRKHSKFADFRGEHITVGGHLGVISSEMWLSAVEKSRRNNMAKVQKSGQKTYLSGLIFCSHCGYKYTTTSGNGYTYFYCRQRKIGSCDSKVGLVRADLLEEIVEHYVKLWLISHSCIKREAKDCTEEAMLRCELANLRCKAKKIQEEIAACNGEEVGFLVESLREIGKKNLLLEKKVAEIQSKSSCNFENLKDLAENFSPLPCSAKKAIVGYIVKKVEISENEMRIYLCYR